jgi:hypothetical protein
MLAFFSAAPVERPASEATRQSERYASISQDFLILGSGIPKHLYLDVRTRFTELIGALVEEDDPREVHRDSLRHALNFLHRSGIRRAPSFSLTDPGDFYLQWFDKALAGIAGIIFKESGQAIWSTAQKNLRVPVRREAAQGTTTLDGLLEVMPVHAPWIF